ncbi:unnamed protein product [Pleuronectes platessa]|uniref:Uncharacterized protein n=1 Tax=Pleuronectes platessa TaxID=8262 RepID=A0A9N7VWN1_PLEPL|nr:unnamed protein product [Pleuronectes platessa]
MRVNIPKDNPNMACQVVPLQSQSMVSNKTHHRGPGPPPVPNANETQGPPPAPRSAHMTQNPPHWIHHRDPRGLRDTMWIGVTIILIPQTCPRLCGLNCNDGLSAIDKQPTAVTLPSAANQLPAS